MRIDQLTPEKQEFVRAVYAKCIEVGDCQIWQGKKTGNGYPSMLLDEKYVVVRRVLGAMKLGRELKSREMASCKCKDPACLEWDHIRVADISVIRAETGAAGGYGSLSKSIRLAMNKRKGAKIDLDGARAIRASEDPSHIEAAKHGISPSMVRLIRRNRKWRELSGHFAGLMT